VRISWNLDWLKEKNCAIMSISSAESHYGTLSRESREYAYRGRFYRHVPHTHLLKRLIQKSSVEALGSQAKNWGADERHLLPTRACLSAIIRMEVPCLRQKGDSSIKVTKWEAKIC